MAINKSLKHQLQEKVIDANVEFENQGERYIEPEVVQNSGRGYSNSPEAREERERDRNSKSIYERLTMNAFLGSPLGNNNVDARTRTVIDFFGQILEKEKNNMNIPNFEFVDFDNKLIGASYPAIVAAHKVYNDRNEVVEVAYAVLLIENEFELHSAPFPYGDKQLTLPLSAYDIYDNLYDKEIRDTITRVICRGDDSITLRYAGVACLYKEIVLKEEQDVRGILNSLMMLCVSAVIEETMIVADPEANLGDMIRDQGLEIRGQLNTRPSTVIDPTGLPVATNLLISMKSDRPNLRGDRHNQNHVHNKNVFEPIIDVGMMLDIVKPSNSGVRHDTWRRGSGRNDSRDQPLTLNPVITYLQRNPDGFVTLSTTLLGIASSMISHDPAVYLDMLRPRRDHDVELSNLGSVGYVALPGERETGPFDVYSADFTAEGDKMLKELINDYFTENSFLSIDIPELSLQGRSLKTLHRTQLQGDQRVAATNRIIYTLDRLTDNLFTERYWDGEEVFTKGAVMIPIGYWTDANGKKRDLREINYLAAVNYAGRMNEPGFLEDWEETFNKDARSPETMCAWRLDLMSRIVGADSIEVKGYAWRYTFDHDFIVACSLAVQDSGISPRFENISTDNRVRRSSGMGNYDGAYVGSDTVSRFSSNATYYRGNRNDRGFNRNRGVDW